MSRYRAAADTLCSAAILSKKARPSNGSGTSEEVSQSSDSFSICDLFEQEVAVSHLSAQMDPN